jgi:hypothetical protein
MSGRYGILPEGILSERVKMIEAVEFPGLSMKEGRQLRRLLRG